MKEPQNRQKIYEDRYMKQYEFEVRDVVYLKTITYKCKVWTSKNAKLVQDTWDYGTVQNPGKDWTSHL